MCGRCFAWFAEVICETIAYAAGQAACFNGICERRVPGEITNAAGSQPVMTAGWRDGKVVTYKVAGKGLA